MTQITKSSSIFSAKCVLICSTFSHEFPNKFIAFLSAAYVSIAPTESSIVHRSVRVSLVACEKFSRSIVGGDFVSWRVDFHFPFFSVI